MLAAPSDEVVPNEGRSPNILLALPVLLWALSDDRPVGNPPDVFPFAPAEWFVGELVPAVDLPAVEPASDDPRAA